MSDEKKYISFHHSLFAKTYEEQANEQGYTFGDYAVLVQKIGFGLMAAHVHGLITDKECDKIFYRFQTKILAKWVKERKMDNNWEEPAINPCRGCEDYDGKGGCISKGGCGAKMEAE